MGEATGNLFFNGSGVRRDCDDISSKILRNIVRKNIEKHIDQGELERIKKIEELEKETLQNLCVDYDWGSLGVDD